MARPRTYDRAAVLRDAMAVFWRQGYEATSVEDLTEATGLSRSSLYQAFGSKRRLFDEVLDHYLERVPEMTAPLELGGLDAVVGFLENWRRRWRGGGDDQTLGCLIVNSTAELGSNDAAFLPTGAGYRAQLTRAFGAALQAAEERGESAPGTAPGRARLLVALTLGIFLAARGNPDGGEVDDLFDAAVAEVERWRLAA